MAWSMCTKNDVTDFGVAEGELRDSFSDYVEGMIQEYVGSEYLGETPTQVVEYHSGTGGFFLLLNKPPISSITSIYINDTLIESANYVAENTGVRLLEGETFTAGDNNIKITYLSGSATVKASVRFCAALMIVAIVNYRGRGGADASISWGSGLAVKEGEPTPNISIGLTSHLRKIMANTLRRNKIRAR